MYYRHLIFVLLPCLMLSSSLSAAPKKGYLIMNIQHFNWDAFFDGGDFLLTSRLQEGSIPLRRIETLPNDVSQDQLFPCANGSLYQNAATIHLIGESYSQQTNQPPVMFEFNLPPRRNLYTTDTEGPVPVFNELKWVQTQGGSGQSQSRQIRPAPLACCFRGSQLNADDNQITGTDSQSRRRSFTYFGFTASGHDNLWDSEHFSGFTFAPTYYLIPAELSPSGEVQESSVFISLIMPHHEQVNLPSPPPRPTIMERMRTLLGNFFATFVVVSTRPKFHR